MAGPARIKIDYILGFLLALTLLVGGVGWWHMRSMAGTIRSLYAENLVAANHLSDAERGLWELRFALPIYVLGTAEVRAEINADADRFRRQVDANMEAYSALPLSPEEQEHLDAWRKAYAHYSATRPQFFTLVDAEKIEEAKALRAKEIGPAGGKAVVTLSRLIDVQRRRGAEKQADAEARSLLATIASGILVAVSAAAFLALGVVLRRVIFGSVERVKGSSVELTNAARQQLTSAKELTAKTTEIGMSLQDLIAMSTQIEGSSGRVARIAEETRRRAKEGGETVHVSKETIAGIHRKVELIATHMLELGKKSSEIGRVLGIIDDLSEQTNILAINATIEAAGGGESARRFAVVADEIRKLADRVSRSTREIRALISGVQGATDSTVVATREGSMAVDDGVRDFSAMLTAFSGIVERIAATTQAARQIELHTAQQITSVESVSQAIADILRATRDLEAASGQTLQTSSELLSVSEGLAARFVA